VGSGEGLFEEVMQEIFELYHERDNINQNYDGENKTLKHKPVDAGRVSACV
jgi:hypothetical protein